MPSRRETSWLRSVTPSRAMVATIQIGITFAGFLSSAFASEAFASELAPILNNLIPQVSVVVWNSISIILITIILSYFTLIFGELVPKRIAMKYSEKIAFGTIGVIRIVSIITSPFVKFLTFSTNIVSKIFGVSGEDEETVTEEEIRMMVDVGEEKGTIDTSEKEMINNVFEFDDKIVSEIMIPRTEMFAVDANSSISEVIDELSEDGRYSKVPVYEEDLDEITGIVYIKDILISQKNKNNNNNNRNNNNQNNPAEFGEDFNFDNLNEQNQNEQNRNNNNQNQRNNNRNNNNNNL